MPVYSTCSHCGKSFPHDPYRTALYCSRACCDAAKIARRPVVQCGYCGKSVIHPLSSHAKFCSRACSDAALRDGRPTESVCEECGKTFSHYPSRQPRFCSLPCRDEAARREGANRPPPVRPTNPPKADPAAKSLTCIDDGLDVRRRFESFTQKTDQCWLWTGGLSPRSGYGKFWFQGRTIGAHRASYALYVGPIPEGMIVCHRCDNPQCVRPDHLFLGMPLDNMADMRAKGRQRYRPPMICGESIGNHKLTADQVREIRHLLATRAMLKQDIAARFGISRTTLHRIERGTIWRQLLS